MCGHPDRTGMHWLRMPVRLGWPDGNGLALHGPSGNISQGLKQRHCDLHCFTVNVQHVQTHICMHARAFYPRGEGVAGLHEFGIRFHDVEFPGRFVEVTPEAYPDAILRVAIVLGVNPNFVIQIIWIMSVLTMLSTLCYKLSTWP